MKYKNSEMLGDNGGEMLYLRKSFVANVKR